MISHMVKLVQLIVAVTARAFAISQTGFVLHVKLDIQAIIAQKVIVHFFVFLLIFDFLRFNDIIKLCAIIRSMLC